jgi:hypothetical protein
MNTPRVIKVMRDLAPIGPIALFALASVVGTVVAANPVDVKAIDANRPANAPSFETHEAAAQMVCGGPVLESGNDIVAGHVIVVPLNGKVTRMDTTEAWGRVRSKTTADDVWVIGVCRKDVHW